MKKHIFLVDDDEDEVFDETHPGHDKPFCAVGAFDNHFVGYVCLAMFDGKGNRGVFRE